MRIVPASTPEQIAEVRRLFEEYWAAFGFTPCFQNFDAELASLPGKYEPPDGRLALAYVDDITAGCIALRRFDAQRAEAKRLYVRPQFRSNGVGRALLDWVIAEARGAGYREIVGDTLPVMQTALRMYARMGFARSPGAEDTIYLRRPL
jgi:putative acetyltransferase